MIKDEEISVRELLLMHIEESKNWRINHDLSLQQANQLHITFRDMAMEELAAIKTKTASHAIDIEKFNKLEIKADGILWFGKIMTIVITALGSVWAFLFHK